MGREASESTKSYTLDNDQSERLQVQLANTCTLTNMQTHLHTNAHKNKRAPIARKLHEIHRQLMRTNHLVLKSKQVRVSRSLQTLCWSGLFYLASAKAGQNLL